MSDRKLKATVCGSFRRGRHQLMADIAELKVKGVEILSPLNVHTVEDFGAESEGFVFLKGEEERLPGDVEAEHLAAVRRSDFVWLHTVDHLGTEVGPGNESEIIGYYLGPSAAFEIGMAHALGIPVYTRHGFPEVALRGFVFEVGSPATAVLQFCSNRAWAQAPTKALDVLQAYYKEKCKERGWSGEDVRDCMLLFTEEVGELARAVRRRAGISRHGSRVTGTEVEKDVGQELADVQLYVLHLANILGVDLDREVQLKEVVNQGRFASMAARAGDHEE